MAIHPDRYKTQEGYKQDPSMQKVTHYILWPVISGCLIATFFLLGQQLLDKPLSPTAQPRNEQISTIYSPDYYRGSANPLFPPVPPIQTSPYSFSGLGHGPVSYAEAVEHAAPAVVNIYTTKSTNKAKGGLYDDPYFKPFLNSKKTAENSQVVSLGSGVIVSSEGYALTNHHVIRDAEKIHIALRDGRKTTAKVVGTDPDSDLAVLKIQLDNLPAISITSSDSLRVGDVVLAIGNPFGVGQTVTMGIVSATGRNELGLTTFEDFIQTDAAINLGNSGGALVNARGQLIGINTAILSEPGGGTNGIGFAIPSTLTTRIMYDIIEHGMAVRGWLGITTQDLTPELAESFSIPINVAGVIVAGVFPEGPAYHARMQAGDVITSINKTSVTEHHQAHNLMAKLQPGTQVLVEYIRNGEIKEVVTQVVMRPPGPPRKQ